MGGKGILYIEYNGGILSWGFCPGGFCLGDFVLGGILSRGILSRGILSGGFCPRGFCPGGFCPRTDWNIGRDFILQIALHVSGSSVATSIVRMVSYLWIIFFEQLKANVAPFLFLVSIHFLGS